METFEAYEWAAIYRIANKLDAEFLGHHDPNLNLAVELFKIGRSAGRKSFADDLHTHFEENPYVQPE